MNDPRELAASFVDIRVAGIAAETEGVLLLVRTVIRAFFHLLTFGLIPENPRAAVRVLLRSTGEMIHESDSRLDSEDAASIADQMQADADRMTLQEFCVEWNISLPKEASDEP